MNGNNQNNTSVVGPYRPRQLIMIVQGDRASPHITGHDRALFDQFEDLIQYKTSETAIHVGEDRRGSRAFDGDGLSSYHQEFIFAERKDKAVYNFFRTLRDVASLDRIKTEIFIIEPSEDMTFAVDAWKMSEVTVGKIRNRATPMRNLHIVVEQHEDGSDWYNFQTEIVLSGKLSHHFSLLEQGTQLLTAITLPKGLVELAVGPRPVGEEPPSGE